jgi:hypothetical protein
MKHFLLLLLLAPLFSEAQNCQLKKFKDQFSQEPKVSTGFMRFSSTSLSIDADAKEIDFLFSVANNGDSKCFDDNSTITFVYEGGKLKSNFKNTGTMNCEGLVHITFRNLATTPSNLQRLLTKKVQTISLKGSNESATTITLSPEQQQLFMDMATCLVQEAKTLIK